MPTNPDAIAAKYGGTATPTANPDAIAMKYGGLAQSASQSGSLSLGKTEMKGDSFGSKALRTILSLLPAAGMTTGAVVGSAGGPAGEIGGGALGGAAGESARQLAAKVIYGGGPQTSTDAAKEVGVQGLVGAGSAALGLGAKAIAPSIAEGALGVSRPARTFGKTPGKAILDETSGIRPGKVMESANQAWKNLNATLESAAAASPNPTTVQPALKIISDAQAAAMKRGNKALFDRLEDLHNFLTTNPVTGQTRPIVRSASEMLDTKRGLNEEMKAWTPEAKTAIDSIMRKVYGALDKELDSAVPIAAKVNQRISSLIPVEQRARATSQGAEVAQRVMHRVGAHTGALIGAGVGYREYGPTGGLVGLVAPELLASPTFQMLMARALATKGLVPAVTGTAAQLPRKSDIPEGR